MRTLYRSGFMHEELIVHAIQSNEAVICARDAKLIKSILSIINTPTAFVQTITEYIFSVECAYPLQAAQSKRTTPEDEMPLLEFLPAGHFIRVAQHDVRGSRNYDPKTKGVYVNLTDAATTLATPIKLTAAQTYKIAALMKPRKVSN